MSLFSIQVSKTYNVTKWNGHIINNEMTVPGEECRENNSVARAGSWPPTTINRSIRQFWRDWWTVHGKLWL